MSQRNTSQVISISISPLFSNNSLSSKGLLKSLGQLLLTRDRTSLHGCQFWHQLTHGAVETPISRIVGPVESTSLISAFYVQLAGYSAGTSQNPTKPLFFLQFYMTCPIAPAALCSYTAVLGARPKIDFLKIDPSREAPIWGYPVLCASANYGTAPMIGILRSILFPRSSFFSLSSSLYS